MSRASVLLVVDDDPNDLLFIRKGLAKAGVGDAIRQVRDGEEAVAYIEGSGAYQDRRLHPPPSLILLDLKLPKKPGFELLEWIRARPDLKDVQVIVLTSSDAECDKVRARKLGATAYHVKPVEFLDFRRLVESIGRDWLAATMRVKRD